MIRRAAVLLLVAALLPGCAKVTVFGHEIGGERTRAQREVSQAGAVAAAPDAGVATSRVAAVLIQYTDAAQQQMQEEPRFTARALREAVLEEFNARGLIEDASGGVASIQVDEFSLRNSSNVVVFGSIATLGKLGARLEVQGPGGSSVRKSSVRVEASLTLRKDGENPEELKKLYRRFAQAIADELTGAPRSVVEDGDVRP